MGVANFRLGLKDTMQQIKLPRLFMLIFTFIDYHSHPQQPFLLFSKSRPNSKLYRMQGMRDGFRSSNNRLTLTTHDVKLIETVSSN